MAVSLGSAILTIGGDASGLNQALTRAEGITQSSMSKIADHARTIGYGLTAIGAGITGVLGLAVREAINFESAFAGVRKTMDGSEAEFAAISAQIRELSREIPVSAEELAKIAEMGAQLGIRKEDIIAFTRTIADMSVATDMTGEAAATLLAQFINITQLDQSKIGNLGAAIVELGNNGASTENQIAEMALRLAGAGTVAGLSAQDILGFSSVLASLGIDAEAGGTAFSKVFMMLASSVDQGGNSLNQFAQVSGMTSQQFVQQWQTSPAAAVTSFVEGLGRIESSGGSLFTVLEALDIKEIRLRDSLLRASGAGDMVADSIKMANAAFTENTALTDEASKRYATTASQLQLLKNDVMEIARTVGEVLSPPLRELVGYFRDIADKVIAWVTANPQLTQTIVVVTAAIGTIATVLGPLLILMPGIVATIGALAGAFTMALSPLGLFAAGITAGLVGAFYLLRQHMEEAKAWVTANWDQIVRIFEAAKTAIGSVMQILGSVLRAAWLVISAIFIGEVEGVLGSLNKMTVGGKEYSQDFLGTIEMLADSINMWLPKIADLFKGMADWLASHWDDIVKTTRFAVDNIISPMMELAGTFVRVFSIVSQAASGILWAIQQVAAWFGWSPAGAAPTGPAAGAPGMARGGRGSGWTWVGEQGPELLNLPKGSRVMNNGDSQNAAFGGGGVTVNMGGITVNGADNPRDIAKQVMVEIERAVQNKFAKTGRRLATA